MRINCGVGTSISSWVYDGCEYLQSITFEHTIWECKIEISGGTWTEIQLANPTQNVTYLKDTYVNYMWRCVA